MNKQEAVDRLRSVQAKSDELADQLFELRVARRAAKKVALAADFGCECDSNECHTEKPNEPIGAGETDSYCHDDQDAGKVSVFCVSGDIEIRISRAVWSEFEPFDSKRLTTGQSWNKDIPSASNWYDQTNRVEIIGHANSTYNLDFKSWDA